MSENRAHVNAALEPHFQPQREELHNSKTPDIEDIMSAFINFITDLAQSIFTPGPTSSLVLATNISFACLQLVLLVLLIATYSIHFVILSIISAGLWAGINWFVNELQTLKAQEEEEARRKSSQAAGDAGDDTETEVDTAVATGKAAPGSQGLEPGQQRGRAKERGDWGSRSEISTEDEWERVDENEKDR